MSVDALQINTAKFQIAKSEDRSDYSLGNFYFVPKTDFYISKYLFLSDKVETEKEKYAYYKSFPSPDFAIEHLLNEIATWEYQECSVQLTEDSLIAKIKLEQSKTLYLTLFLDKKTDENIFFNYYEGDESVRNGIGNFTEVFNDLINLKIVNKSEFNDLISSSPFTTKQISE